MIIHANVALTILSYVLAVASAIVVGWVLRIPILPERPIRQSWTISIIFPTTVLALGFTAIIFKLGYSGIYWQLSLESSLQYSPSTFWKDYYLDPKWRNHKMDEIIAIIIAAVLSWLNFVLIDTWMGLPEAPGVKGAEVIGRAVKKRGGDLAGGFFQGNIVCSPDASAGTLLASASCYAIGTPEGGFIAALLVCIGNRLCADPGYAGTTGALTITCVIFAASYIGIDPADFIVGMVLAIVTNTGNSPPTRI